MYKGDSMPIPTNSEYDVKENSLAIQQVMAMSKYTMTKTTIKDFFALKRFLLTKQN